MEHHNLTLPISTLLLFFKGKAGTFNELSSLLGHTRRGRTRPPSPGRPPREREAALAQEGGRARRSQRCSSRAQATSTSSLARGSRAEGAVPLQCEYPSFPLCWRGCLRTRKHKRKEPLGLFMVAFPFVGSFCYHDFTTFCCCSI